MHLESLVCDPSARIFLFPGEELYCGYVITKHFTMTSQWFIDILGSTPLRAQSSGSVFHTVSMLFDTEHRMTPPMRKEAGLTGWAQRGYIGYMV